MARYPILALEFISVNDSFDICFSTTRDSDFPYLAVAIHSLVDTFSIPEKLVIHLLLSDISEESMERLRLSLKTLPAQIRFYDHTGALSNFRDRRDRGYYLWCQFADFLPLNISQLLYLDCDVVVCKDLSPVFEIGRDYALAAVADPMSRLDGYAQDLGRAASKHDLEYDPDGPYFNSGVVLVDVQYWRKNNITQRLNHLFEYVAPSCRFNDQDILNLLFQNQTKYLSPTWNLTESLLDYHSWDHELYRGIQTNLQSPEIRHYAGFYKPDSEWIRTTERLQYFAYLKRTAFFELGKNEITLKSQTVELHYQLMRSLVHTTKPNWSEILELLKRSPYLLAVYPAFVLYLVLGRAKAAIDRATKTRGQGTK